MTGISGYMEKTVTSLTRRCGNPRCSRSPGGLQQIGYAEATRNERLSVYCHVQCSKEAAARRVKLQNALRKIDEERARGDAKEVNVEDLNRWELRILWELDGIPKRNSLKTTPGQSR